MTYELDVISTEYADDVTPNLTGDLTRSGSVRPVGVFTALKGRLHLRLANCGFPADRMDFKGENSPFDLNISESQRKLSMFTSC